ncbi:MAG: SusC/RagA family TonB-linked outer membrane protein [Bacteroidales bacterium]|nr:SusC/RagA family TonB-linked outer membrane protein [Bacteroidales bacterium]
MRKILLIFALCIGLVSSLFAQQRITGTVLDQDGYTLPGATVLEKGTSNGTVTDLDGKYTLTVSSDAVLSFSFVGMVTVEEEVGNRSVIDVTLMYETIGIDEVVVTALGISRERKSLGYAIQKIDGDQILEARESNVANALSGKVSGLQVIRSSNGPAGSSKIVLRGNSSLTGDNQPLIVVDGTPIDNFTGADNNDYWNPSTDMGNGLGDINPEDIESMSVLKGASAAALYGSRAGNGVILITTKSGVKREGLGITVSSSVGIESIFSNPKMQSAFGQGSQNIYDPRSNLSWGPKIAGQSVESWNGQSVPMQAYDNVGNYFKSGVNFNNNVSFQQQYENTSLYTSVTHMDDKSMIPGSDLKRVNFMTRALSNFGPDKRWSLDTKVQYINSSATNRPLVGVNASNSFYTTYLMPRSLDITGFSNPLTETGQMLWYGGSQQANPYWTSKYNLNTDSRDRFILHGALKYKFADWLNAEVRAGSDIYTTNTENKLYGGSPAATGGRYSMGKQTHFENNFSTLIMASKDNLFGKVGGALTLGGNLMQQQGSGLNGSAGELEVPNLFALNNGVSNPTIDEWFNNKKINSVYGTMQLNYDGYLFLDATFRNDWSSTLHKDNSSYFYPSVNVAWVVSDMLSKSYDLPNWFSFGKLRASYAEVGNDLSPYQLYNTYWIGKDQNGNTTAGMGNTLFDSSVKSELIKSYEVGAELKFFKNRLGLDFAWYKSNATRQLINLPMDPMSGYESRKINAGDIQNRGVELEMYGVILPGNNNGLRWDMLLNYSFNRNTIKALADGVDTYQIGGFDALRILAEVGGNYGEIYGTTFQRVTDESSQYFGQKIVDANGLPLYNTERSKLGNQQPNAMVGWSNTFLYKGISLSFLIDGRFGGDIFSGTNHAMQLAGTSNVTVIDGERADMIVDAVVADGTGFKKNDQSITAEQYWTQIGAGGGNLGIVEANIYDATNIRLRTVQVGYELPKKLLTNTVLTRTKFSVSANNVWMIKSNLNGVDPESVFATGTNAVGFENAAPPTSRSFLFNVTLGF